MQLQNTGLLKVMSILKIVGAAISIVAVVILLGSISFLAVAAAGTGLLSGSLKTLCLAAVIFTVLAIVLEMICGIFGLQACNTLAKADLCIKLGIVSLALSVVSNIFSMVYFTSYSGNVVSSIIGMIINLLLSVLYIVGALNVKKSNS